MDKLAKGPKGGKSKLDLLKGAGKKVVAANRVDDTEKKPKFKKRKKIPSEAVCAKLQSKLKAACVGTAPAKFFKKFDKDRRAPGARGAAGGTAFRSGNLSEKPLPNSSSVRESLRETGSRPRRASGRARGRAGGPPAAGRATSTRTS